MTSPEIKQAASDKAFANLTMLLIDIEKTSEDIRRGRVGPITIDELHSLHKGLLKDKKYSDIKDLLDNNDNKINRKIIALISEKNERKSKTGKNFCFLKFSAIVIPVHVLPTPVP